MKKRISLLATLMVVAFATVALAQNTSNYNEQGGARTVIGGSLDVISGGEIDVESGGALKIGGTAATASAAELNYLDITTLGTGAASKAIVLDASGDYTFPATATIVLPSGGDITAASGSTVDIAGTFELANVAMTSSASELNYNDITTLGTAQASKVLTFDGSLDAILPTGALTTYQSGAQLTLASGATLSIAGATVAPEPVINPGRDFFTICGEATTVNNNTVYYGPSTTLTANTANGQACDINEAGNVTEATADAPIYTNKAVQVLGMTCRNEGDANANVSFTLRTAAGDTVPSVTCTIADGERDCVADVQTTTAVAAGATVAIAAASSSDIGDANGFVCKVDVAY